MTMASRRRKSSRTVAAQNSSRRFRSQRSVEGLLTSGRLFSTKAKAFRPKNSNTIQLRSSMTCVSRSIDGAHCQINLWQVTPETARLLEHWRHHDFSGIRPFFCQVEAVETAIWLTEVAPNAGATGKRLLDTSQTRTKKPIPI